MQSGIVLGSLFLEDLSFTSIDEILYTMSNMYEDYVFQIVINNHGRKVIVAALRGSTLENALKITDEWSELELAYQQDIRNSQKHNPYSLSKITDGDLLGTLSL